MFLDTPVIWLLMNMITSDKFRLHTQLGSFVQKPVSLMVCTCDMCTRDVFYVAVHFGLLDRVHAMREKSKISPR